MLALIGHPAGNLFGQICLLHGMKRLPSWMGAFRGKYRCGRVLVLFTAQICTVCFQALDLGGMQQICPIAVSLSLGIHVAGRS